MNRAGAPKHVAVSSASIPDAKKSAQILAALNVTLPQAKVASGYGVAMGALALFLVLLPLAYVTLAGFLAWLLVWHVFQTFASLQYGPYFVFHVPMALLSGLLLLFLAKPIFFRLKDKEQDVIALQPEHEPLLFEFVRRLCAVTGAPVPDRIEVDCDPNAAAGVRNRFLGLFGGKFVLRIGLPLVAGMNVRQFAGVLGHEFGHFNQRSGMAGSYLIRRLNHFFAVVVFHRDRLDERLERMRHAGGAFWPLVYWIAVAFIEPMRGVLWLMLLIGELLTSAVLRRMEFDADEVEAHVAGVADFIRTNKLLMFLSIASHRAKRDLVDALERKQLADDFPRLIAFNARQLAEHRDDILKILESGKTDWFDTHPCHNDRVQHVQQIGAAGEVNCSLSASAIFTDFRGLCRVSTGAFYRDALGDEKFAEVQAKSRLVPTDEIAADRAEHRQRAKVLRRYFRNQLAMTRPIFPFPSAVEPAHDGRKEYQVLLAAREAMLKEAENLGQTVEQYETAMAAMPTAAAHISLCQIFHASDATHSLHRKAHQLRLEQEPILIRTSRQLAMFEEPARQRLNHALRLLQRDDVVAKLLPEFAADGTPLPTPDPRPQARRFIEIAQSLHAVLPKIVRLREEGTALNALMAAYNPSNPFPPLVDRIFAADNRLLDLLVSIQTELCEVPYPFSHGEDGVTIGVALVDTLPTQDKPGAVNDAAATAFDQFFTITYRVLANLTELAERVEGALRIAPLPEPPEVESENEKQEEQEEKKKTRRYWLSYGGRAVAGVALVIVIVMLSLSPPNLPKMPWESASAARERRRPSGFNSSVGNYSNYRPSTPTYYGSPAYGGPGQQSSPYSPNPYTPRTPTYQPYTPPSPPSYQPRQPSYQPPQPYRPSYTPPGGGGYSPGRPGGGGYSPGGGRR
jgi:Zn-dependent protease with chaperone function